MPASTDTGSVQPGEDGWLTGVRRVVSPNWDERPAAAAVELIVVHGISLPPGSFETRWIEALFTNTLDCQADPYFARLKDLYVSAHLLIDRDGEPTQFVPLTGRAWHAGVSSFQGRPRCNDFSIGIEFVGADDIPYTPAQYEMGARIVKRLLEHYRLTPDRVVGHCDIAPGRKTDPGPSFDWRGFRGRLGSG